MRSLPAVLALVAALAACSSDGGNEPGGDDGTTSPAADPSSAAAEPTGEVAAPSCARVSATELSEWLGAEVSIAESPATREDPDAVRCEAIGEPGAFVILEWRLDDVAPRTPDAPDQVAVVSAEGEAEDGRVITATATRFSPDSDVTDAALQTAVDNLVAAYAEPGRPTPAGDDPCALVGDDELSVWAGFPIDVGEGRESGEDWLCRTVVGDEPGGYDAFALVEWRLGPPFETLAAEAGSAGQDTEAITLPGGQPAVASYWEGFRKAVVAAQAGERTVVVEVTGDGMSEEGAYSSERLLELAGAIADAYAG